MRRNVWALTMTPTQRTLALLRKHGWTVQVVERWCSFSRRRIDLFGVIDVLAINDSLTIGIQTTSGSCVSARIKKSLESDQLVRWLSGQNRKFFVHGWRKLKKTGKWECREIQILQIGRAHV